MSLDDFISAMGALLYGKQRFFRQDNATWYDRQECDYVSTATVLDRIYHNCSSELG